MKMMQKLVNATVEKYLQFDSGYLLIEGKGCFKHAISTTYFYDNGSFYFCGSKSKYMCDFWRDGDRTSFSFTDVFGADTFINGLVVFGNIRTVMKVAEYERVIIQHALKYYAESFDINTDYIDFIKKHMVVMKLTIDNIFLEIHKNNFKKYPLNKDGYADSLKS